MELGKYFDRMIIVSLLGVFGFSGSDINQTVEQISNDMREMNKNVAIILNESSNQKETIKELKERIYILERRIQ